ncbi:MAG: hypothetical protein EOO85_14860 [Pedobacter sp.]|nr:MAG: hypothetical protein EOO85_14860 [Pedobacter sp.]
MMHAPKKYLFILLLTAFIPVVSALESFAQQSKLEKVYMHTDKSQYAINDTIWFTGYVTEGNKNIASKISKVIYVDLLDQADSVLKRAKLELINGSATGHFGLRGDANQGLFRIRAYTLWMRNFDKQYFFNKSIRIGGSSAKINNKPTKYDAEFLPEGGAMIDNIPGKVAFKAVDEQGRGIDVTGLLKTEKGEELVRFKSQHYGMGIFNFTPQAAIKYVAHMVFPDGSQKQYTLQEAKKSGYSLAVVQSADSLNIQIKCTKENSKDVRLIIKSPGLPEYVQPLSNSSLQTAISIAKENLPIGISQISLLDGANQVLAKRLVFIRNAKTLKLDIIPKKAVYKKGSRMSININAITPNGFDNTGTFSLSVAEISADLNEEDEVTILSNLLLSSELKGYVENPNYYFIGTDTTRQMFLDYLMLTQQYRPDQAEELVDPKFLQKQMACTQQAW